MVTGDAQVPRVHLDMLRRGYAPYRFQGQAGPLAMDGKYRVTLPQTIMEKMSKLPHFDPSHVFLMPTGVEGTLEGLLVTDKERFLDTIQLEEHEDEYFYAMIQMVPLEHSSSKRFTLPSLYRPVFSEHAGQYTLLGNNDTFYLISGDDVAEGERLNAPRYMERMLYG